MADFLIGRSPGCDLVLNHACVSSHHAVIRRAADGVPHLEDLGSANGTFINKISNEIEGAITLHEDDIVLFSPEYKVPVGLLLEKFVRWEKSDGRARCVLALGQVHRFKADRVTLGSAATNKVVLPYLDVRPHHAEIVRQPDGSRVLMDLGGGCTVDGNRVHEASVPVRSNCTIEIGGALISLSFDPGGQIITIGTERRGFYLTAENINFSVPTLGGRRRLVNDVGFSIMPGEFVGLLGPSGCGKTTLLTCLAGVLPAGGVLYNGRPFTIATATNTIGYVPQDDLLYPELTVRETLYYSARLRLSAEITRQRIHEKIDEVCNVLKLVDPPKDIDLRNTLIGSPEHKTLSGGQKKRVNLALALITNPLVLLLDEPTSGLSSHDTRLVMETLRELADDKGIPIIITIHQPSLRNYKLLDHAIYLTGGRLAWFGPAYPDSVQYFVASESENAGADEVMEAVDEADPEVLQNRYAQTRYAQKFVTQRGALIHSVTRGGELAVPRPAKALHLPGQAWLMLERQLIRRWRDTVSLAIQMGQAPLLGLMIGLAFANDRMNNPLFLMGFIAIWFGANATARELVSERVNFTREKRGGVSPAATLAAKLTGHGIALLVQCALLFLSVCLLIRINTPLVTGVFILWLCGLCGAALGFIISALMKTELSATVVTPLVLIPLILFGGYLPLYDNAPVAVRAISQIMPSRWGYEAMVQVEKRHQTAYELLRNDTNSTKQFFEFTSAKPGRITPSDRDRRVTFCMLMLVVTSTVLMSGAWVLLCRVS